MPATEAQKRAMKKWREEHPEYTRNYYRANKEKMDDAKRRCIIKHKLPKDIERLKAELAHKQQLLDMYEASRAQDSPITTDEDSD